MRSLGSQAWQTLIALLLLGCSNDGWRATKHSDSNSPESRRALSELTRDIDQIRECLIRNRTPAEQTALIAYAEKVHEECRPTSPMDVGLGDCLGPGGEAMFRHSGLDPFAHYIGRRIQKDCSGSVYSLDGIARKLTSCIETTELKLLSETKEGVTVGYRLSLPREASAALQALLDLESASVTVRFEAFDDDGFRVAQTELGPLTATDAWQVERSHELDERSFRARFRRSSAVFRIEPQEESLLASATARKLLDSAGIKAGPRDR